MSGETKEYINGKFLYYAFLSGSKRILQNQSELNRINVFPVSDKDTGTNLASTMRSVIDSISPHKSYKTTVENIAEAALVGARGNSGVIFAQFLYGLSQETRNKPSITFSDFAVSVKNSIPYIYEAVANPVEGTILTVIKDWSEFIASKNAKIHNFRNVIIDSFEVLEKSLKETTSKLGELNKYGFVDAGAKGFVLFIEGIIDFINNRNIRKLVTDTTENITLIHTEDMVDEEIRYRYCTEAMLKDLSMSKADLQQLLSRYGDSVVIAGSERISRIHVHTSMPAQLFYKLKDHARITFQKVDDMIRQQQAVSQRKWNIALVTDSTCDLSDELLDHYQINMLPLNLYFGHDHYLDKVTVQPDQFYDLLETSEEFPTTSQINERAFTNLYSHLASHYDAIISIHLTGQFSGTYSSAVKAAGRIRKEFNKPVRVIDSRNLSGGLGLLVLKAAQEIDAGKTVDAIADKIESLRNDARIYVSVKNLKYMVKGGRVSKPKGFIAGLFGLNPVVSMGEDGKSRLFGKTFSQEASLKKIFSHIEKLSKEKPVWNYVMLHAHNPEGAQKAQDRMREITGKDPVSVVNISPVIGMHAGNGAISVSILFDNQ
ncbi:MAG: DegV family protein [Bacteroidales bacterium]|nr:DegV family protein [Bacteroidales bacterium]